MLAEGAFRAGHYKDLTETGNRARKVSGTQGTNTHFPFVEENVLFIAKIIFQTKHRSQTIFPIAVFSFCLSHMFITHVVIDIFILYYSFLFYYAIFMGMD